MAVRHYCLLFGTCVFPLLGVLRDAMRIRDLSVTKAAQWQEIDPGQFERQLQGIEHLSLKRLHKLPYGVIQEFFWQGALLFGPPPKARRGLLLQLAIMSNRRMARMIKTAQKVEKSA